MITLPFAFTAIRYPGYFWNTEDCCLYTLKGGTLKKMVKCYPTRFNDYKHGYRISHCGERRWVDMSYLNKLKLVDSVIPIVDNNKR